MAEFGHERDRRNGMIKLIYPCWIQWASIKLHFWVASVKLRARTIIRTCTIVEVFIFFHDVAKKWVFRFPPQSEGFVRVYYIVYLIDGDVIHKNVCYFYHPIKTLSFLLSFILFLLQKCQFLRGQLGRSFLFYFWSTTTCAFFNNLSNKLFGCFHI